MFFSARDWYLFYGYSCWALLYLLYDYDSLPGLSIVTMSKPAKIKWVDVHDHGNFFDFLY